jgi:hypothetical protein
MLTVSSTKNSPTSCTRTTKHENCCVIHARQVKQNLFVKLNYESKICTEAKLITGQHTCCTELETKLQSMNCVSQQTIADSWI